MDYLSIITPVLFIASTFYSLLLFLKASKSKKSIFFYVLAYTSVQGILAWAGFYTIIGAFPPRPLFILLPNVIIFTFLFTTKSGKTWMDNLNLNYLMWVHVVRIPVEIGLYSLFLQKLVPIEMTFEGFNYDIISGLSSLVILAISKNFDNQKPSTAILMWNIICLGLVLTIVTIAIFSLQTPFQQIGLNQPNIAVTLFPYIWLPVVIVPIVVLSHLVAIRRYLIP